MTHATITLCAVMHIYASCQKFSLGRFAPSLPEISTGEASCQTLSYEGCLSSTVMLFQTRSQAHELKLCRFIFLRWRGKSFPLHPLMELRSIG